MEPSGQGYPIPADGPFLGEYVGSVDGHESRVAETAASLGLIRQSHRILLVTHVAPDGDAIGSLLGLGRLLSAQGKDPTLACQDPIPPTCSWLPGSDQLVTAGSGTYDLVISLDCSDVRRLGRVYTDACAATPLLNIDHHITNTGFGHVNWVDPTRAATAQMVLCLAGSAGWTLDQPIATCLLHGLVTDTRGFLTQNVDLEVMRAAMALMEQGALLYQVVQQALEQRPLASIRLWGQAIDHLHLDGGVLWTEITHEMRQRWSAGPDGDSGLVNFLSGIREAKVVILFAERDDGAVDVAMRATPGENVAGLALRLGGGGHPQAAGCTLNGGMLQVRQQVLAEVQRLLDRKTGDA